ncbi:mucin-15 [Thunnus albacares]|uniref:mucin-15 n=1 Tax=Thunnus albacares TaxID=8236 RepID=UPI001CF6D72A|nr:mucin-15 [Thunnus albacares]
MGLHLKITASLLLLVQAFHLAALQDSTDSPGRTIDKSWLRDLAKNLAGGQITAAEEERENDQGAVTDMESNNDYSSGIASGSMVIYNEREENETSQEKSANKTSDDLGVVMTTEPPTFPNVTTKQPELTNTTASTDSTNSSQTNMTETEEEFHNSTATPQNATTHLIAQNSTSFPDASNRTDLQTTTMAPERNVTQEVTTKSEEDTGLTNTTTNVTTTAAPDINKTATNSSSTTVFPSETTEIIPETPTAAAPNTPEKANLTDKNAASGSNSERGLASDSQKSKRHGAWGAVLGVAVAVVFVGLVAYIILKKKHQKGFSHRKLVEEFPSDPVLRLDNNEPLDLNFGGSAYYNPGLQGDNIQMSNFPGRHRN